MRLSSRASLEWDAKWDGASQVDCITWKRPSKFPQGQKMCSEPDCSTQAKITLLGLLGSLASDSPHQDHQLPPGPWAPYH